MTLKAFYAIIFTRNGCFAVKITLTKETYMNVSPVGSNAVEPGKAVDYFDQTETRAKFRKIKEILDDFTDEAIEAINKGAKGEGAEAAAGAAGAAGAGAGA